MSCFPADSNNIMRKLNWLQINVDDCEENIHLAHIFDMDSFIPQAMQNSIINISYGEYLDDIAGVLRDELCEEEEKITKKTTSRRRKKEKLDL